MESTAELLYLVDRYDKDKLFSVQTTLSKANLYNGYSSGKLRVSLIRTRQYTFRGEEEAVTLVR
jgi:hypothetical protein